MNSESIFCSVPRLPPVSAELKLAPWRQLQPTLVPAVGMVLLLLLTQLDVPVQHEQDVAGLQVPVDDLDAVQVDQSLQHLAGHHLDLGLRQPTIQLWPGQEVERESG